MHLSSDQETTCLRVGVVGQSLWERLGFQQAGPLESRPETWAPASLVKLGGVDSNRGAQERERK